MRLLTYLILFFACATGLAQEAFQIEGTRKRTSEKFDLSFNLIKVKAEVNGLELNFLVDTGLKRTIVFNLPPGDSLTIKKGYRTTLRGFGKEAPIEAIYSKGNVMKLGKLVNNDAHIIFLDVLDSDINAKMGGDINGFIGSDLFRELVVMVDYPKEKLRFYRDRAALKRRHKKYQSLPVEIVADKPYVNVTVNQSGKEYAMNVLLDTGSSSSFWYYGKGNTQDRMPQPTKGFKDYLGWGISGRIEGWRSKVGGLQLGDIYFKDLTIAFPNEQSLINAEGVNLPEDGSIGGEILRRTRIIFDYSNQKISIDPEQQLVEEGFYYNMSGVSLSYGQAEAVVRLNTNRKSNVNSNTDRGSPYYSNTYGGSDSNSIYSSYTVSYEILPTILIDQVMENTPAASVDIRPGDIIYKINGRNASTMGIDQISNIFTRSPGKKIRLKIKRDGMLLKKSFRLVPLIE